MTAKDREDLVTKIKALVREYRLQGYKLTDEAFAELTDEELESLYREVVKKADKKFEDDFSKGMTDLSGSVSDDQQRL